MATINIERRSRIILGVMALLLLGIYVAFTLGNNDAVRIGMIITGGLIGILLFIEGGIISYIKSGKFKTITLGDIVVWITFVVGGLIILNSLFLIPMIGEQVPESILNFTKGTSVTIAIIASIMVLIHILTPRFD